MLSHTLTLTARRRDRQCTGMLQFMSGVGGAYKGMHDLQKQMRHKGKHADDCIAVHAQEDLRKSDPLQLLEHG